MSGPPSNHDLAQRLAVLEERMNTIRAESESAYERLRADMAKRETRMLLAIAAMIGLGIAILGVMIQ